jgi:hypothetical protein
MSTTNRRERDKMEGGRIIRNFRGNEGKIKDCPDIFVFKFTDEIFC